MYLSVGHMFIEIRHSAAFDVRHSIPYCHTPAPEYNGCIAQRIRLETENNLYAIDDIPPFSANREYRDRRFSPPFLDSRRNHQCGRFSVVRGQAGGPQPGGHLRRNRSPARFLLDGLGHGIFCSKDGETSAGRLPDKSAVGVMRFSLTPPLHPQSCRTRSARAVCRAAQGKP